MCTICVERFWCGSDCAFRPVSDPVLAAIPADDSAAPAAPGDGLPARLGAMPASPAAPGIADFLSRGFHEWLDPTDEYPDPRHLPGPDGALTVNLEGLAADARPLAEAALAAWADVADLSFREAPPETAQIVFQDDEEGAFNRWRFQHEETGARFLGATVNVFAGATSRFGTDWGDWTYTTYLHEIGHALGLGHSGPYRNFAEAIDEARRSDADTELMSVMSYFRHDGSSHMFGSRAWPVTPQIADILAVREIYGAPQETRPGDTVYGHGSLLEGPLSALAGGPRPVVATLVDTGGHDTLDYSRSTHDLRIDLRPMTFSDVEGLAGGLAIAPGTRIEAARGGAGDDVLTGNAADNRLDGGAGDDTLIGGAGDDVLEGGGGGGDVAVFEGALGAYVLRFSPEGIEVADKGGAGTGTDRLSGVEALRFADELSFGPEGALAVRALDGPLRLDPGDLLDFVKMYIAYFDRAPDALGLAFWATQRAEGMSLDQIATHFFDQDETRAAFAGATGAAELVDRAYANLLERPADAEGRAWWIDRLERGTVSEAGFMLALIEGAEAHDSGGRDMRVLQDKAEIGLAYAVGYGLTDPANARAAMDAYTVDAPAAGLAAAHALIADFSAAASGPESAEAVVEFVGVAADPFLFG